MKKINVRTLKGDRLGRVTVYENTHSSEFEQMKGVKLSANIINKNSNDELSTGFIVYSEQTRIDNRGAVSFY